MNYPVWHLDIFGGGFLIAIVAIVHVYVSHFAVGGGLFLVLTEIKGLRENSEAIIGYTKKHTKFFLLLTMVFGAITGVGIWFIISLLNPGATSSLIHTFVFAWAIEWVFFLCEILSLLLYYYTFNKISSRNHLTLGWLYFVNAWLSLFVINGIIDFMLTPGTWLENRNFWSGFFNPTFWPALFFRTFMSLLIAGLFGFLTSISIKADQLRHTMVRYCGTWLLLPLVLLLISAWWYKIALPPDQQQMIFTGMPELKGVLEGFIFLSPLLFIGGLVMAVCRPQSVRRPVGVVLLVLGLAYIGCFEFIREGGRRPYIIYNHMYSNTILKSELNTFQTKGILKTAKWVKNREVTSENRAAAGRELLKLTCSPCHSEGGLLSDIVPFVKVYTPVGMKAFILSMGVGNPYMPPFPGNENEAAVLADYLAATISGRVPDKRVELSSEEVAIPLFDRNDSEYVLLGGATHGMTLSSNPQASGIDFSFGPPQLRAQLIRRDETPEIISEGVSVRYRFESAQGLQEGEMKVVDSVYQARLDTIPLPKGEFKPHIIAEITAQIDETIVAVTKTKIGISTEVGCRNCHGGEWSQNGVTGLSHETAAHILAKHDQHSQTALVDRFEKGEIVVCSSCHADPSRSAKGDPDHLNLSAAIHGFHATYISQQEGASSCVLCHSINPQGVTRSFDGIHNSLGLDCSNCHGTIVDHAASLLKNEAASGKKRANYLLKRLLGRGEIAQDAIIARKPWIMEPDCLNCHEEFEPPEGDDAFNRWTGDKSQLFHNRKGDEEGILCMSCHGSPHSIYPVRNSYSATLGVLQPLQYQQSPYPIAADKRCDVCHTVEMDEELHHPNSLSTFRNRENE